MRSGPSRPAAAQNGTRRSSSRKTPWVTAVTSIPEGPPSGAAAGSPAGRGRVLERPRPEAVGALQIPDTSSAMTGLTARQAGAAGGGGEGGASPPAASRGGGGRPAAQPP